MKCPKCKKPMKRLATIDEHWIAYKCKICGYEAMGLVGKRVRLKMDLIYPEHKHPHGINDIKPNESRIWVCDECGHIFTDEEIRKDEANGWGHACKSHPCRKGQRCESHLEPYTPDPKNYRLGG